MQKCFQFLATAVLSIASAASLFVSCETMQQPQESSGGTNEIKFVANIGQYSVKATDTAFEENDAVSIAAFAPINSGNVKYTFKNGVLTSDTPICWKNGQTQSNAFVLIYPYDPSIKDLPEDPEDFAYEFCVNADQSTHALYTASDLIIGPTDADPSDSKVEFDLFHALSQVYITIQNNSGKQIADVYLDGVYGKIKFSDNGIEPQGSKGTIKACPVTSGTTNGWVLVMAPQKSKPDLIITTTDQQQIKYTLQTEEEFKSSYKRTANVVIGTDTKVTSFTTEIADWTPDNDLNFSQDAQISWVYSGIGKYIDDIFADLYPGTPHYEMDVEIYYDKNDEMRVMIKNPYKNWPMAGKGFEYVDGGCIIGYKGDNGIYVVKGSSTGIKTPEYGEVMIESICQENGYAQSYYADDYYEGCWCFMAYGSIMAYNGSNLYKPVNNSGMSTVTSPGYNRYPVNLNFSDLSYSEDGLISLIKSIDHTRVGVARINYDESITQDLVDNILAGTAENQIYLGTGLINNGEQKITANGNITKTGVYRLVAVGDFTHTDEKYYYGYNYISVPFVAPGDTAPECKPEIVSIGLNDVDQTSVDYTLRIPYISNCCVCFVPKNEFDALHLSESQYFDYACANGEHKSGSVQNYAGTGQQLQKAGLKAKTEYVVLVAAENRFNNTGWAKTSITTGEDLTFVSLGKGKFYDNFVSEFFSNADNYAVEVEIFQESNGKPIYRVANPYGQLMQQKPELTSDGAYSETASDYIQFSTHQYASGNYLFFQPFDCGISYVYDFTGEGAVPYPITYTQRTGDIYDDPSQHPDTVANVELSEGIFHIAPYILIGKSGYAFDYRYYYGAVFIAFPGHDIDELDTKTSLKSQSKNQVHLKFTKIEY